MGFDSSNRPNEENSEETNKSRTEIFRCWKKRIEIRAEFVFVDNPKIYQNQQSSINDGYFHGQISCLRKFSMKNNFRFVKRKKKFDDQQTMIDELYLSTLGQYP